jgi:hypothetical protein
MYPWVHFGLTTQKMIYSRYFSKMRIFHPISRLFFILGSCYKQRKQHRLWAGVKHVDRSDSNKALPVPYRWLALCSFEELEVRG